MKILFADGYLKPNGNTAALSELAAAALLSAGHEVETIPLRKLAVNDCLHCDKCLDTQQCIQKDDMTALFKKILAADALVISSPVYFWHMSGVSRLFIDRLYSVSSKLKDKRLGFIATAGGDAFDGLELAVLSLQKTAHYTGMKMAGTLYRAPSGDKNDWNREQLNKDVQRFVLELTETDT